MDVTTQETYPDKFIAQSNADDDDDDYVDPNDNSSDYVFLWLLIFSIMMFTLPFLAFYGTKEWLHNSFGINGFENNCYAVLAAVIVVNFILILYAILAFREDCSRKKKN